MFNSRGSDPFLHIRSRYRSPTPNRSLSKSTQQISKKIPAKVKLNESLNDIPKQPDFDNSFGSSQSLSDGSSSQSELADHQNNDPGTASRNEKSSAIEGLKLLSAIESLSQCMSSSTATETFVRKSSLISYPNEENAALTPLEESPTDQHGTGATGTVGNNNSYCTSSSGGLVNKENACANNNISLGLENSTGAGLNGARSFPGADECVNSSDERGSEDDVVEDLLSPCPCEIVPALDAVTTSCPPEVLAVSLTDSCHSQCTSCSSAGASNSTTESPNNTSNSAAASTESASSNNSANTVVNLLTATAMTDSCTDSLSSAATLVDEVAGNGRMTESCDSISSLERSQEINKDAGPS